MTLTESIKKDINKKAPPGSLLKGVVTVHATFGIMLDIGLENVTGVIDLTDFLDEGKMNYSFYPPIGTQIETVVIGAVVLNPYSLSQQTKLSLKPSILKKAYERLTQSKIKIINLGTRSDKITQRPPIGSLIKGTVFIHTPFCVILNLLLDGILGRIAFTEFMDEGQMDYDFYPTLNTKIEAVVVAYRNSMQYDFYPRINSKVDSVVTGFSNYHELELSIKPSILKKAREKSILNSCDVQTFL